MKRRILGCLCLLGLSGSAWSLDTGPASAQQQETEAWLQLQTRGAVASPIIQVSTPTERDRSFQRWLDTYKHEIPDFYEQERGGKISSGGSTH